MGGFLVLVGFGGIIFGIVNLVRPLGRLRIGTRGQAGAVIAGSLVVMIIGGALLPPDSESEPVSSATTVVLSTSTSTSQAPSTTRQPATTSTSSAPTTSLASTTTTDSGSLALGLLLTIPIELETPDGYDRDLFPLWSDADGNGCDTRDEVLIRDAAGTADVGATLGAEESSQ